MNPFAILAREFRFFQDVQLLKKWTGDISPDSDFLVADDFERAVDAFPDNIAFRFEGRSMTYAQFDALASRFANWAMAQGLKAGDCISLFMENRPEYVAAWAGFSKAGLVTALINHNLEGDALAHCVNIAQTKLIVTGAEQDETMRAAMGLLQGTPPVWSLGGTFGGDLGGALEAFSDKRPDRTHRAGLLGKDMCLYVYTSGTTGLPKAARLTQARTQGMMRSFIAPCRITPKDKVYVTLPLYHGTGGLCGIGQALMTGATVVVRRKFSASAFWDDAVDEGVTSIVYIGELCRYLLNSPPHPKERAHHIRTGFGNGLRPEVWQAFLDRFNIPHLCEFYGSTEGNVSFLNFDGKVGAVGRIPGWLKSQFKHIAFVRFDVESEQPVRGPDGLCIRAEVDEPGEALGLIGDDVRQRFEGYNDQKATEKKLLRDVFEKGDLWFRTGDLLRMDKDGYIYFVDRIGDTFRWKGENVSTNEVGEALSQIEGIRTANVYGVPIPGTDGKAGMAAITVEGDVDFAGLYKALDARLPTYAVPIFIRVQPEAETTGTFKYRKVELVADGFDPAKVHEPLWVLDPDEERYVLMSPARYDKLLAGGYRY
jgi:fatty-acyl-CoA synthase